MQTENHHVAIERFPAHEDWARAQGLFLKLISISKGRNVPPFIEINFFGFMVCVLFILEKVGVKKLMSAKDTMRCLEKIYHENELFYPSRIFRGAWPNIDTLGMKNDASTAKGFLERLNEMGMISSACGRENISLWVISDRGNEETRKLFCRDLELACRILKCEQNKKYISQISWVAYNLLKAMTEGEMENI
jgi:hypothetical protein